MQLVLEQGSIYKLMAFDIGLIQLSFHTSVFTVKLARVCTLVLFIFNCTTTEVSCSSILEITTRSHLILDT